MKINEKNLCVFATTPPFDLEGFLNKRGEVNKAWQKRYYVVKGNLLFYFERKGHKEPLGLIIVEGCTIELAEDGEQYSFQIIFNGNRTYTLSAESQDVMEIWMKTLTCASYEYKKLMVAELQRQLEEIEDAQKKQETIQPIQPPKPPPRRQNPFNRPAPPPPVLSTATVSNDITSKPSVSQATAVQTATAIDTIQNSEMNNGNSNYTRSYANTSIASTSQSSRSGDDQQYHHHSQHQQHHQEISFRTIHAAFAKEILTDLNERRKQKEDSEKPLIIL